MTSHNQFVLSEKIVGLSESDIWDLARAEWELVSIYFADDHETCLCSHYPIKEVCVLRNKTNFNTAEVGNVCVNKFLGIPSKIIFDGIKRVSKDLEKALNKSAVHFAYRKNWLNEWEFEFCINTATLRNPSANRLAKRVQINRKILRNMRK